MMLQMQYSKSDGGVAPRYDEGEDMVRQLQATQTGVDAKLHESQIQLFRNRQLIASGDQLENDAPDAAVEPAQGVDSDSEAAESESEGGASEGDDSEGDSDLESEEEEEQGAPSSNGMPQEQAEVNSIGHVSVGLSVRVSVSVWCVIVHPRQGLCTSGVVLLVSA